MADTEQGGVSPASAGGASAPIPEVPPHPNYVDNAVAGALTDMYGFLPLDVRYSAAAAARAVVECWTQLVRDHAEGRSRRYSEVRDRIYRALGEEPPAVLGLWADLAKQVDRLIDTLTVEVAQHDQTKADLERANDQAIKATNERNELTAERDRLRAELDPINERRPKFQPGQRVRVGLCDGIVITPKDTTRVQFEGMLHTFDIPTRDVHAIDDIAPTEPRRWVAGDAEPEIGTTVRLAADWSRTWTRTSNGGWHPNHACRHEHSDQCSGLVFAQWEQLPRPLVEVVSADG